MYENSSCTKQYKILSAFTGHICFQDLETRKRVYYFNTDFWFSVVLHLSLFWSPRFPFVIFSLQLKGLPLIFLFKEQILWWKIISFSSSELVSILPGGVYSKDMKPQWQFSFSTLEVHPWSCGLPVPDEISCHLTMSPACHVLVLSGCFQCFSLHNFFLLVWRFVGFFLLGDHQYFWIFKSIFSTKFGRFSPSSNIVCVPMSSQSGTSMAWMLELLMSSQKSLKLDLFFSKDSFFFLSILQIRKLLLICLQAHSWFSHHHSGSEPIQRTLHIL